MIEIVYQLYLLWVLVHGVGTCTLLWTERVLYFREFISVVASWSWFFRNCDHIHPQPFSVNWWPQRMTDRQELSYLREFRIMKNTGWDPDALSCSWGRFWLTETIESWFVSCLEGDSPWKLNSAWAFLLNIFQLWRELEGLETEVGGNPYSLANKLRSRGRHFSDLLLATQTSSVAELELEVRSTGFVVQYRCLCVLMLT